MTKKSYCDITHNYSHPNSIKHNAKKAHNCNENNKYKIIMVIK